MHTIKDIENLISPKYPKLFGRIRQLIEDSEREYSQDKGSKEESFDSFLWEHTLHVAAYAKKIAIAEEVNPTDAVITALFHDSGKFMGGQYHDDETPEEGSAAELAHKIFTEECVDPEKIETITAAITALYSEKTPANKITDVVHDADFLAKFGYLGVANFFTKSTLRGKPLLKTLISSLSKELTYAAALETNMRTAAGKKMADKKSAATLDYYQGLLDELREGGIAFFKIMHKAFPCPKKPDKFITLHMAVPEACPECSGLLMMDFSSQTKTKCEQLTASINCNKCPNHYEISFCLPEICG
ncbi:MAG: HD domain-containing protein [Candidatus Aminicenantes bacterium]|jgi:uncharacterized protein